MHLDQEVYMLLGQSVQSDQRLQEHGHTSRIRVHVGSSLVVRAEAFG